MSRCQHCGAENASDARFCGACGKAVSATEPSTLTPSGAPDRVGREIGGRYRILAKLGEGGMGAVYRGEQISLKRKVAIKLLHPELSADPALVRRFNAEAELVAKLSHPHTVNIYDFGQDSDGAMFIAMEFLEGRSLRQAIATEGPIPPARALHIAQQIASSIADAHHHGIVHRDLKPDNVMLTERGRDKDVVRVLDFGIAKLRDDQKATVNPMTRAGDLVGTPQYMAPEQIRGEKVDGRTDVYALGAILYEMLTGRLVFDGPSLMAILSRHLLDAPEPPSRRRPDLGLPPALDGLVLEMLAKSPSDRLPSMEVVIERLAQIAASLGFATGAGTWPGATPTGAGQRPSSPPGAPMMRPPGVPHTYPPGAMQPVPQTPPPPYPPPPGPPPVAAAPTPSPAPPPQYPQHTPPVGAYPTTEVARRGGSMTWLWVLIGVVLVAGGIGAYVALSKKDAAAPGTEAGEVVSLGAYQVTLPLGFIEDPGAAAALGAGIDGHAYTGSVDGKIAEVLLYASAEDLSASPRDELDAACQTIAQALYGGQMNGSRTVADGAQRYRCTMAGSGRAVEAAFYTGPAGTLLALFAADPETFDSLRPTREALFARVRAR